MSENPVIQPRLSPDFAAAVLEAVDRHRVQRRRLRWLTGASLVCVAMAAAALWRDSAVTSRSAPPARASVFAAASDVQEPNATPDSTGDPLSYLFPDAAPLARYAAEDNGTDNNDAGSLFDDQE